MTDAPTGWHPAEVVAAVHKAGKTMRDLALDAGFHPTRMSHALKWPVPTANQTIAEFLGLPTHEIWPEWFDEDGTLRPDWKANTMRAAAQRQKRGAA